MAHYEADKMVALLQFCSWKAKTDMTHTGLHELNTVLERYAINEDQVPNEKYWVDALSDAKGAVKRNDILTKKKEYIDLLLQYAGFDSWHDWKEAFYASVEYIQPEQTDLSGFSEINIGLWHTEILTRSLTTLVSGVQSTLPFQVDLLPCADEAPSNYVHQMMEHLKECAFILWILPVGWKDQPKQMNNPSWAEVMNSGRVVPIWVNPDDLNQQEAPTIPALKKHQLIHGLPGILTTLLYLQEKLAGYNTKDTLDNHPGNSTKTPGIQNINNNSSGVFFQGNGVFNNNVQHIERSPDRN